MEELLLKTYRTVEAALLDKGRITTEDVPPELLAYLREGIRLNPGAQRVEQGIFPFPLPSFLQGLEVSEDGLGLAYSDYVTIDLPQEDFDGGDIVEFEYSDDPFVDTGIMSTRRYKRLKEGLKNIFSKKDPFAEGPPKITTEPKPVFENAPAVDPYAEGPPTIRDADEY